MWFNKCVTGAFENENKKTLVITGENKPGFIGGMIDISEEAGGQRFQSRPLKHAPYPGKEIGFQLQAQGTAEGHSTICRGQSQGSATSWFDVLH